MEDEYLDIGVFSLSLMGTNYPAFILEANRVIKLGGKLFIAEVLSRFKDINEFTTLMKDKAGFKPIKVNKLKDYFYIMVFQKIKAVDENKFDGEEFE